jgi:soluble lytic murein transglycosylase-like protein
VRPLIPLLTLGVLGTGVPVHAELVYLTTGRSMSVKSHRAEGDILVLQLRGGGEMTLESRLVDRITPDEVPYPEPQPEPAMVAELSAGQPAALPATQYAALIEQAAATHGVDARLVQAVIQVESNYERRARSRKGAMGLMQLMPATARQYGVKNPYDPASNIEAGVKHLKSLLERFPLSLALAAYNAGEEAVRRFSGVPPYPETRSYVAKILSLAGPQ